MTPRVVAEIESASTLTAVIADGLGATILPASMAAADAALAGPLVRAVAEFDPTLIVSSSSSRAIEGAAAQCGLRVATTFLADRA